MTDMPVKMILFIIIVNSFLIACSTTKCDFTAAKISFCRHDYSLAFDNLIKVTKESRDPAAQYALGYMYYYGLGIAKDQDIARSWITKAAKQNYWPAMEALSSIKKVRAIQYVPFEAKH